VPALALDSGWRRRAVEGSDLVRRAAEKTVQQAENLIAAARVLYYETSGEPFTIQQLTDKAGVSLQTFYRYFRSKDELLIAVLEEYLRELADRARAELETIPDPQDRLCAAIRWCFRYVAAPESTPYHSLITREHLRLSIDYPAGVRTAGEPYRVLLRDILTVLAADGRLSASADCEQLAVFIGDLITSQVHHQNLGIEPADADDVADALVRFCLGGIGIPQA
jgi:AcrR family transcriptional regulator